MTQAAALMFVVAVFSAGCPVRAAVRVPRVFADNMVLQRDKPLPIWGWADPEEKVAVTLGKNTVSVTADVHGRWKAKLPALHSGGPLQLTVAGSNRLTLKNILIGEVWVCSGQSNMGFTVSRSIHAKQEVAAANYPRIRLFKIPRRPSASPQQDVQASWTACTPKTIGSFSAVAYFFGRYLHKKLDAPIGLIDTSWGGTRIEPWTPPVGFHSVPKLARLAKRVDAQSQTAKGSPRVPTHLYNGMVHPIVPFAIRGAIWYQGESNRADGMLYYEKMKALINGWRSVWHGGEFPFLYVQLAPYRYRGDATMLPKIWEAQLKSLTIPNTGMAVITDIGNLSNIHPKNKQDVGQRLALWALARTYGKKGFVYSGPLYQSATVEGSAMRIRFTHTGRGLKSRDGKPLSDFTIAGSDGRFVPATATIDGQTVVVSSKTVKKPVAVRFGWNQLAQPNLANSAGLPASPFRTVRK